MTSLCRSLFLTAGVLCVLTGAANAETIVPSQNNGVSANNQALPTNNGGPVKVAVNVNASNRIYNVPSGTTIRVTGNGNGFVYVFDITPANNGTPLFPNPVRGGNSRILNNGTVKIFVNNQPEFVNNR